jgi:hypothetical protein
MEKALAAMHQAGLRQTPVTLVYGPVGGETGLLLTCTREQHERVLGPITANYPQCSVSAVDDEAVRLGLSTWFVDLHLRPELFPILRHTQFDGALEADVTCSHGVKSFSAAKGFSVGDTDFETIFLYPNSHAGYYPGAKMLAIKVLFRKSDGPLLGAQVLGEDGVPKRIDSLAMALAHDLTLPNGK